MSQALRAIGPSIGKRQLPTAAKSKPLPEIEVGIAIKLTVIVVGGGGDSRVESRTTIQVMGPGVSQREEYIPELGNFGLPLRQARQQPVVIAIVEAGKSRDEPVRVRGQALTLIQDAVGRSQNHRILVDPGQQVVGRTSRVTQFSHETGAYLALDAEVVLIDVRSLQMYIDHVVAGPEARKESSSIEVNVRGRRYLRGKWIHSLGRLVGMGKYRTGPIGRKRIGRQCGILHDGGAKIGR